MAKYLGWWTGPSGKEYAWAEALKKYENAYRRWASGSWGMALAARISNTYLQSILGLIAQFTPPSDQVLQQEYTRLSN